MSDYLLGIIIIFLLAGIITRMDNEKIERLPKKEREKFMKEQEKKIKKGKKLEENLIKIGLGILFFIFLLLIWNYVL